MESIEAVVTLLEQGAAGVGGTTIFAGSDVNLPTESTPPFITVLQTAGRPPIGVHNSTSLRQPAFQIVVRGDIYTDVQDVTKQAFEALGGIQGLSNILVGDVFFLSMRPSSEPFDLTPDAQQRVRLAFNVNALRR